jgi:hypothetical protein
MFGDTIGDKLWETVNTYFCALFEEYKEMYAPKDKTPQPTESESTTENGKKRVGGWKWLSRSTVRVALSNLR